MSKKPTTAPVGDSHVITPKSKNPLDGFKTKAEIKAEADALKASKAKAVAEAREAKKAKDEADKKAKADSNARIASLKAIVREGETNLKNAKKSLAEAVKAHAKLTAPAKKTAKAVKAPAKVVAPVAKKVASKVSKKG